MTADGITDESATTGEFQARRYQHGDTCICFNAAIFPIAHEIPFDANAITGQYTMTGSAAGRGTTLFFHGEERDLVLRHYRRGGFMARLSEDCYLWHGEGATRAEREWELLIGMRAQGLPVPEPVAIRVQRSGWCYRADIITARLRHTATFMDLLAEERLPASAWVEVGRTVGRFHAAGVYHADLNAANILIDDAGAVFLIDFDRARRRRPGGWQGANLKRLRRSLDKAAAQGRVRFAETDWAALLSAWEEAVRDAGGAGQGSRAP